MNDNSPTHLQGSSGTFTSIDLSICHPSLLLDYSWETEEETCGSDHYPIILKSDHSVPTNIPSWNISKANWPLFEQLCYNGINSMDFSQSENPIEDFTNIL